MIHSTNPVTRGRSRADRPPRVLHVAQPTDGGVRRYVHAVIADQCSRGWQVAVACPGGPLAVDLEALGVLRHDWPATRSPGVTAIRETLALRKIIHYVDPDVVHLHSSKAGFAGRLAVRRLRPTIFQPHGWSWLAVTGKVKWLTIRWERAGSRWTSVLVCVGHDELTAGLDAGINAHTQVVRNGVDRVRFSPAGDADRIHARRALDVSLDSPLVVCAGRLGRQKGQDVLLSAWPTVRAACPSAQLAIIGDGDLSAELRRGAGPGVRFVPTVADLRPWLAAADVVAVPSRWEGLPLTALEAAAMGRSVVGSAIPGLSEVVRPAMGCLVTPDDPLALAAALTQRLGDLSLTASEGREAVKQAKSFDLRETLDQLALLTLGAAHHGRPVRLISSPQPPLDLAASRGSQPTRKAARRA